VASDGAGNLYLADTVNSRIRKVVVATGVVTTLAGGPTQTGGADGTGPDARFTRPTGIASDGAGDVYVTDGDDTLRKIVVATRTVTTLAGAPTQTGNVDGTGLFARFIAPNSVSGDGAGNLYIADSLTIRQVTLPGAAVRTVAGGPNARIGDAQFAGPAGVVSDGAGNLYVADAGLDTCNCIRKVVIATGEVTTLAGNPYDSTADGTGTDARFTAPKGIAGDGAGNLYVTDSSTVRKVVSATGVVTTFAGAAYEFGGADGAGAAARFTAPWAIASDGAGNLYVADGNVIRKIAIASATVSTVIGAAGHVGVSLGALPASLNNPRGLVVLPTGELAIVDYAENAVLIAHL
jgi:hypothetical protein